MDTYSKNAREQLIEFYGELAQSSRKSFALIAKVPRSVFPTNTSNGGEWATIVVDYCRDHELIRPLIMALKSTYKYSKQLLAIEEALKDGTDDSLKPTASKDTTWQTRVTADPTTELGEKIADALIASGAIDREAMIEVITAELKKARLPDTPD